MGETSSRFRCRGSGRRSSGAALCRLRPFASLPRPSFPPPLPSRGAGALCNRAAHLTLRRARSATAAQANAAQPRRLNLLGRAPGPECAQLPCGPGVEPPERGSGRGPAPFATRARKAPGDVPRRRRDSESP